MKHQSRLPREQETLSEFLGGPAVLQNEDRSKETSSLMIRVVHSVESENGSRQGALHSLRFACY